MDEKYSIHVAMQVSSIYSTAAWNRRENISERMKHSTELDANGLTWNKEIGSLCSNSKKKTAK